VARKNQNWTFEPILNIELLLSDIDSNVFKKRDTKNIIFNYPIGNLVSVVIRLLGDVCTSTSNSLLCMASTSCCVCPTIYREPSIVLSCIYV